MSSASASNASNASASTSASTSDIPSLCIGYALDRCTPEQVKEVFNYVLDEDVVSDVSVLDKTNFKTGRPFKVIFINFKNNSESLALLVERIKTEGFVNIQYDNPWFWKVTMAKPKTEKSDKPEPDKPKSVARIMARDE
jgi:hypothetical protein